MSKVNVKITGHKFQYDVYQILVLFFEKDDIKFVDDDDEINVESILLSDSQSALCRINLNGVTAEEKVYFGDSTSRVMKNAIKISIMKCLRYIKKVDIPWGILIGIRPTKIAHEYFNKGLNSNEVVKLLENDYLLSDEKALLAVEVAKNEKPFLYRRPNGIGLYIDIPFCPTRCIYCSFASNPAKGNEELIEKYLQSLIKEIKYSAEVIRSRRMVVDTVYIGGGTPTALTANQMDRLLNVIEESIDLSYNREFTIECGRPDSIDKDKLSVIMSHNCSRISINPQTMKDETLKSIGRIHTTQDIIEKYYLAREMGFNNINMDIIIGLPGEDKEDVKRTMEELKKLNPDAITIHTMALKRASKLRETGEFKRSELAAEMYNIASKEVREMGMSPYYMYRQKNMVSPLENVGYSYKGKECIYNIQMIAENISIIAFGAGAISKLVYPLEDRIERAPNLKDVREYVMRIDEMIEKKKWAIENMYVDHLDI